MKKFLTLLFVIVHAAYSQEKSEQVTLAQIRNAEQNVVVLRNSGNLIPLVKLQDLRIASLHFGSAHAATFDSIANKYWKVDSFNADTIRSGEQFNFLHDQLKLYNLVVFSFSPETKYNTDLLAFVSGMERSRKTVMVVGGSGKDLGYLERSISPIIFSADDSRASASAAAQALFGGLAATKELDASFGKTFLKGAGHQTKKIRLGYSVPEAVALDHKFETGIDSIVKAGIAAHSAPAVVVLVAKDGQVVFNRSYGSHTYKGTSRTKVDDIFDMASVTKVTATTPSIMRLYDQKMISLNDSISKYVASIRNIDDKKDVTIKEALLHEAGFYPYIKFFEHLKPGDMSTDSSAVYPVKVADNYYLRANYFNEVMWPMTLRSKGNTRGKFVYSDVSMYMLKEVVEQVTHTRLNEFVAREFYLPLGMQATGYLPRNRFDKSRIVPTTENDNWFRDMLVQGYVNDPGAAMSGGVQGHAGLFSNANDLAIYYQMLLNKGEYGGDRFFDAATVELFTSRQSKVSERGLGFARVTERELNAKKGFPSEKAFGHSGYTGTYVWVDPVYNLVFICLTNRVYPDDGKTYGVSKVNMRSQILDHVYRSVINSQKQAQ